MAERIISQPELERIVQQDAEIIISAGLGRPGEVVSQRLFEDFRRQWQPSVSDKEYTALFRTYSNWVIAAVANHLKPGSVIPAPSVSATSIQDGDEIPRPDAEPMKVAQLESLVREAQLMAEHAAYEIASTTRNGGDGKEALSERLDSFLRFAAAQKPNEDESDKLLKAYQTALNSALQRELDSGASTSQSSSRSSGCLGVVALFALTPLALLLTWAYA